MKQYEIMLLAPAGQDKEAYTAMQKKIETLISDGGGKVVDFNDIGERKLAYEINHANHAYYFLWWFDGPPTLPAEINAKLRIDEKVIRHLTTERNAASTFELKTGREGR